MPASRVAITGMGVVSAFGCGVRSFWDALSHGRSGIRPIIGLRAVSFSERRASIGLRPRPSISMRSSLMLIDRFAQYALVAAAEAMTSSGLTTVDAIVTGCSAGGQDAMDAGFVDLYQKNSPRVNPMMVPRVMSSGAASHIAMELRCHGSGVFRLNRVFFSESRDRPGVLDGAERRMC